MAGTVNAGSIVYEVDIDTARLIQGRREVDAALNGLNNGMGRLEASVNRTERSVANMDRSMSNLSGVARGLMAALSVQQVANYADAWTTLNNKLANAVRPQEQLVDVTSRVFEITQQTRSSLDATATLYARLERGTREYNTSAEDLAKLTTIINQGFVVSGATAQEAENAIIQLSQGIASGALRGEEFNSVAEQGSRLMVALADSLGVGIGQLRSMAAEGKLTTDVVVNGLLSQGDAIGKEFANTVTTISQAMQVAGNNITKFFGENATVKSFVSAFNDSIVSVSENLDSLSTALLGAAVIMGGRYAGAFAMATAAQATHLKSTIQGIVATRQSAQQEAAAASVIARKAVADKEAALSALNLATAEYNVAKGSAAEAFALENVIRLRGIYIQTSASAAVANNTLSASQARVAATGFTLANTMKAINVATTPLGGPIGVIAIVAAGWYLYSQRQEEARRESIAFADALPQVISRLKEMNLVQAQGVRADTVDSIKAQKEEVKRLEEELANLANRYKDAKVAADNSTEGQWLNNDATETAADLANKIAKARRDLDGKTATLQQTEDAYRLINIQVNEGIVDQMKAARDNALATAEAEKQASFLGGTQAFLAMKLGQTTEKLKEFNSEALKIDWGGKEGEKLIKQAERRLALSKAEGTARAELQATFDAEDAGIADERAIARLQDVYVKTQQATEAKKEKNKEDRAAESASKKAASAEESVSQKLEKLRAQSDLTTESIEKRRIQEAGLRAEQSLGSAATQQQLAEARALGEANEKAAISLQKRKEAEQGQKFARQEIASTQSTVDPATGEAADPLAQINLQEQQKLEALAKYQELDKQNAQLYEDAKTAIQKNASMQRREIADQEAERQQQNMSQLLGATSQFFDQMAGALGDYAGESSAAYKALYAVSKGFAIAQASMNLITAISNAAALPWPANIPAMAAAAAQGASLISQLRGSNYGGGRKNGGPVTADRLYEFGEGNLPEILQVGGKSYMLPGNNGRVISNKDIGSPSIPKASVGKEFIGDTNYQDNAHKSGSQVSVVINFTDQTSGGKHVLETGDAQQYGNYVTVDMILYDQDVNGPITSNFAQIFGLSRQANGDY